MKGVVDSLDKRVDAFFDRLRGRAVFDRVFYGASRIGEHSGVWIVLSIVRYLRGSATDRRSGLRCLIIVFVEAFVVNIVLKSFFRRHRPNHSIEHPHALREPWTSSFPSGHASAGFCAATLLSEGDPMLAPAYFALAALIALSRIHVRLHHASDVVGGALFGTVFGVIGRRVAPLGGR